MDILNDKILLAITADEANVLQLALSQWQGPWTEEQRRFLTLGEMQEASRKLRIGRDICAKLQQELTDRFEAEETRKASNY